MFAIVNAFIYFFASSVHFRLKSLLLGSFIAAAIWSVAKLGFDFYIKNLTNMEAVYGVIATLPIFLFWIYMNWVIILLGVELISYLEKTDREKKRKEKRLATEVHRKHREKKKEILTQLSPSLSELP
jgi:membrane protein